MDTDTYEIIEFIDLLDYTFSNKFIEKWRHKYSTAFIKEISAIELLKSMSLIRSLLRRRSSLVST